MKPPKDPISTVTNLSYIIVGLLRMNPLTTPALFVLFASSTAFHWNDKFRKAQTADVLGMYLVFNSYMANFMWDAGLSLWIAVGFVLLATIFMSIFRRAFETIPTIGYQLLIVVMMQFQAGGSFWFLAFFAGAMVFNLPFLFPKTFTRITGITLNDFWRDVSHGIWHILSSLGFYKI